MGGKAKSRCRLDMLKVNNLNQSYLNIMKFKNGGPAVKCFKNNHETSHMLYFLFFTITFKP
jgi:hypothetical protein